MFMKTALRQTKEKTNLVTMTVLLVSLGATQRSNAKKEEETYFVTYAGHNEISSTIC